MVSTFGFALQFGMINVVYYLVSWSDEHVRFSYVSGCPNHFGNSTLIELSI